MHLKLISCELFKREVQTVIARSTNDIEAEFLPKSLHQLTELEVRKGLQSLVETVDRSRFHAVLLVSGPSLLCLNGLHASEVPLVLPRATDCLSILADRPRSFGHGPGSQTCNSRRSVSSKSLHSRRQEQSSSAPGQVWWVAPVRESDRASHPAAGTSGIWDWRNQFSSPTPACGRESVYRSAEAFGRAKRHETPLRLHQKRVPQPVVSLLQLLVDGYWSYDDFVVVAPGWQVVARGGAIATEEMPL